MNTLLTTMILRTIKTWRPGIFAASEAGEWNFFDITHPFLQILEEALGEELTAGFCAKKYAQVWNAANNPPSDE